MVLPKPSTIGQAFLNELKPQTVEVRPSGASFAFVDSKTFLTTDYKLDWAIPKILVQGQPAVMGGPKKSLKTSVLVDMAVSLASRKSFLGKFRVDNTLRVGVMSGESGAATLQETFRRVAKAKGISEPQKLPIQWEFKLPRLSDPQHLDALSEVIARHQLKVLFLDPLYLCLLTGDSSRQASNLFDVGPLLADVSAACLEAGATPVFVHHTKKQPGSHPSKSTVHDPPELEDLAFAGIQEYARQWLLLGRRERYEPDSGKHHLWLSVGGSVGHSGCWAVDVHEGHLQDNFSGRIWQVDVRPAGEEWQAAARRRDQAKIERDRAQETADAASILRALVRWPRGATQADLVSATRLPKKRIGVALEQLCADGDIDRVEVLKPGGRGKHRYDGYRLSRARANMPRCTGNGLAVCHG